MSHTPGPWECGGLYLGPYAHVVMSDGTSVVKAHASGHAGLREEDASLIAAAPDLYQAAVQGVAELLVARSLVYEPATDPVAWIDGVMLRLQNAIAKSEGR